MQSVREFQTDLNYIYRLLTSSPVHVVTGW